MGTLRPLLTALVCLALVACSEHDSWTEEAKLPDGRVVSVERSVTIESSQSSADGWMKSPTTYAIRVTDPVTGERVSWRGEYGMSPILLGFSGPSAYLVILPNHCDADLKKYGSPNPPYIALRYDRHRWVQMPLAELPPTLNRANLSFSYMPHMIEQSRLSSDAVENSNSMSEYSTSGHFQKDIPLDFESWKSKYKDSKGYRSCR